MKYPMFEVLDLPDSNITCERRSSTTVPTQALTLMNDEFVLLQAQYFADRVRNESGADPAAQLRTLYRIALSRDPSPAEMIGQRRIPEKTAGLACEPETRG